jgi:hypothetical protein
VAVWPFERHNSIGTAVHRPSELVNGVVMSTTKRDEVVEVGLSTQLPRDHVVYLGEVHEAATGESAAFVPSGDLYSLLCRGTASYPLLIQDATVTALDGEHDLGITSQTSRYLTGDWPQSGNFGNAIRT